MKQRDEQKYMTMHCASNLLTQALGCSVAAERTEPCLYTVFCHWIQNFRKK